LAKNIHSPPSNTVNASVICGLLHPYFFSFIMALFDGETKSLMAIISIKIPSIFPAETPKAQAGIFRPGPLAL
jgi:hypothetical protein